MKSIKSAGVPLFLKLVVIIVFTAIIIGGCSSEEGIPPVADIIDDNETQSYTISGTISGLENDTVQISNNQESPITFSDNGVLSLSIESGTSYDLSVLKNPTEQLCRIENGSSSSVDANITNVNIICESVSTAVSCTGSADSDEDGLTDCAELSTWGTNPWLTDTDGDSYLDAEEVSAFDSENNHYLKNPRIADMAKIAINITSLPNIEIVYETSTGVEETVSTSHEQGSSNSITKDWGGENSRQVEIGHTASISTTTTVGVEVEISPVPSTTFNLETSLTAGFESSISATNGSSVNWSSSEEQANSVAYEESYTKSQNSELTYTGGILEITASVENEGNIPYDLENLTLSAYFYDPRHPFDLEPIGTLEYGSGGFPTTSILSHSESAPLNFSINDLSLSKAERLLRDSKNIVIMPATFRLLDTDDNSILLRDEDVSTRTAAVTVDYGINAARQDKYRIAVNTGDGTKSISLFSALADVMGLSVSQGPGQWIYGDDSAVTTTENGLLAVGSYIMNANTNQYWLLAHNHTTNVGGDRSTDFYHILNEGYDLNNILLRAGDKVTLVYVGDADRDGLSDRMERDYGTDPNKYDTDDDTLMDAIEVYGWYTNLATAPCDVGDLTHVYSNPLLVDSDEDNISDSDEKTQCMNPSFDFVAKAGDDQFVNVGSNVILYGDIQSNTPLTTVNYEWLLLSGSAVYVNETATNQLSGREPSFTAPSEVSTLVFELEVTMDGFTMTDTVKVQVQKDRMNTVYVGEPVAGIEADGTQSKPYSSLEIAFLKINPGDDLYVMAKDTPYVLTDTFLVPDGTSLFGGYDANWVRNVEYNKAYIDFNTSQDKKPGILIEAASKEMWFSGFSLSVDGRSGTAGNNVIGLQIKIIDANNTFPVHITNNTIVASNVPDGTSLAASSSYALHISNIDEVYISGNTILAGNGGQGEDGTNGDNGASGGNGSNGGGGYINASIGSGGAGGSPGGGAGGDGAYYPFASYTAATSGAEGAHNDATGGAGGTAGSGSAGDSGEPGWKQVNITDGNGGREGIYDEFYVTASGANGATGLLGGSGGGGGGGASATGFLVWVTGGGGGGGGGGGSGGLFGTGGSGGGTSVGIWLHKTATADIRNNNITTTFGGTGQSGGVGGLGGAGGNGGASGASYTYLGITSYKGGSGGAGGSGSSGGNGGAGAGGPSIGVVVTTDCAAILNGNTITGGYGGNGGLYLDRTTTAGHGGSSYAIYDANLADAYTPILNSDTANTFVLGVGGIGGDATDATGGTVAETNF